MLMLRAEDVISIVERLRKIYHTRAWKEKPYMDRVLGPSEHFLYI